MEYFQPFAIFAVRGWQSPPGPPLKNPVARRETASLLFQTFFGGPGRHEHRARRRSAFLKELQEDVGSAARSPDLFRWQCPPKKVPWHRQSACELQARSGSADPVTF